MLWCENNAVATQKKTKWALVMPQGQQRCSVQQSSRSLCVLCAMVVWRVFRRTSDKYVTQHSKYVCTCSHVLVVCSHHTACLVSSCVVCENQTKRRTPGTAPRMPRAAQRCSVQQSPCWCCVTYDGAGRFICRIYADFAKEICRDVHIIRVRAWCL